MLKYLLEKEFKQFFRNKFLLGLSIMFPLVVLLIFPLIANMDVKNINLSILDNDKSSYSRELINKIQSSGYFRISNIATTYEEALMSIEKNKADILLEIPPQFEKKLVNEKNGQVMITANAVNGLKGGLGGSYLTSIIADFNSEVRLAWMDNASQSNIPIVEATPLYKFNPTLNYRTYMIPAIIVMIVSMICAFLPCLNIVSEKENGTIEQMNVTPVGRFQLILSKLIPYWLIGFVSLTICILVAYFVYGLAPKGNILLIYFYVSIFVIGISGFGLIVSNKAKSLQQAMLMMFFFVITFIFISGLYTPIENMPLWARTISYISPLRYIIEVFRMIYLKDSGFFDLIPQLIAFCCFAVVFNVWAVLSYRKSE